MRCFATFTLALCTFLYALPAEAHFIWLTLKDADEAAPQVQLYFGEQPEPGNPHLIGKVAAVQAWARDGKGESVALSLKNAPNERLAALVAPWKSDGAASIEAFCDYGVYDRGPGVLLQYYAKHLAGNWQSAAGNLGRSDKLALDVVPRIDGDELTLLVTYQGKPCPDSEIVVIDANGSEQTLKADANGHATLRAPKKRCAARAAHIEIERQGQRDGKMYKQTWHYCTLTFDVSAAGAADNNLAWPEGETSAAAALVRARAARSVWNDFPGFAAEVTVTSEAGPMQGKMQISSDGDVSLEMADSPVAGWVEEQLQTLVQHRMPDGEVTEGTIAYSDEDKSHPLGRKIDLGDPNTQSIYRIKDDVIMEVNRNAGKMRFTISVLEVSRNTEGKYLPRSFTMNFFDASSGELMTSLAYFNDWQRVGGFDLPKTIVETSAQRGGAHTRQIVFSNCRLLDKATTEAKTSDLTEK